MTMKVSVTNRVASLITLMMVVYNSHDRNSNDSRNESSNYTQDSSTKCNDISVTVCFHPLKSWVSMSCCQPTVGICLTFYVRNNSIMPDKTSLGQ